MRSIPPSCEKPASPISAVTYLAPGEILDGRYRIEACLGGGGMATVYRAVHTGLDHAVAVKVVAPQIRHVPGVVTRFLREARAATRLRGEHVVRVFDVGTAANGSPYLVMELLEGKDLGCIIDEAGALPVEESVDYCLQACEALAEVHGLGIVHRDLKPANLFVACGPDGRACVKLIDFGISRIESPLLPKDTLALTSPDVAMGSPRYMPPEQMEAAGSVTARSDIWSLGAILYEMLVGTAPFDGESLWDIYAAAMHPPKRPSAVRGDVPRELDEVVLRCLRADPSERFEDVAALAAALAPLGDETGAVRADAVARVFDASRGQDPHSAEGTLGGHVARSPSSRFRRRPTSAWGRARRWTMAGASAAVVLGAVLFARRPLPALPSMSAATNAKPPAELEVGAPVTLDSITIVGAAVPAPEASASSSSSSSPASEDRPPSPPAVTARPPRASRTTAPVSAPAPKAPSPLDHGADFDVSRDSTMHVVLEPPATPPPTATATATASADDRALFEERK